jgi:hypothetical protein
MNKTLTPQEVRSLHVHCDVSSRYFVLYGPSSPEKASDLRYVIDKMSMTFVCH